MGFIKLPKGTNSMINCQLILKEVGYGTNRD